MLLKMGLLEFCSARDIQKLAKAMMDLSSDQDLNDAGGSRQGTQSAISGRLM